MREGVRDQGLRDVAEIVKEETMKFRNQATCRTAWGSAGGQCQARSAFAVALVGLCCMGPSVAGAQAGTGATMVSVTSVNRPGNGFSNGVGIDHSGQIVGFYSDASNLVPLDTNQARDVFVRDTVRGLTERVSVSSSGQQANGPSHPAGGNVALSADGSVVAFYSAATNLVPGDTNGRNDVFVRIRPTNETERVSVASDGSQANGHSYYPSLSADGRWVAFQSEATNLVPDDRNGRSDIFVRDRVAGTTERLCGVEGNGSSSHPSISADGALVAFSSAASNLVPGDTNGRLDIFVCDRLAGTIERVSVSATGEQGNGDSILPWISGDGRFVAFKSLASNLVPDDRNGVVDVFVYDRQSGQIERVSVSFSGGNANDFSFPPVINEDGRFVAFGSAATNLIFNDSNHVANVFVRDRQVGVTVIADVNDRGELGNNGVPDVPFAISADGQRVAFVSFATNLGVGGASAGQVYMGTNPFFGPGACPDGICPNGQVCVSGFCVTPSPTATLTRTATPTVTHTPSPTRTPTPTFRPCVDDRDCRPDEHCRGGTCKKKRPCDDADPDVDRLNCFDREACVDGLCECGGDCNRDGFVFGDEVTNSVFVLGGLLPLDACKTADINGDGEVMGNEITQVVLNLARGCVQEGRPLIFAHDRAETVTISLHAEPADGGTAVLTVGASGGAGELATVQLDVLYDPSLVDIGDATRSCKLDERLRASHILLATEPNSPAPPQGTRRLRLFAGDLSYPIQSFADGTVFRCTFRRLDGSSGEAQFTADRLNVGDARANTFRVQATRGGVTLEVPTPQAEPTPQALCAGDCNGDGQVMGNEISTVVQVMAGRSALAECPAADSNGDGEVTVGDLTRAVLRLARGCP